MKVEPVFIYRRPKYPRIGEDIQSSNVFFSRNKNAVLVAAMIAVSSTLAGCDAPFGRTQGSPPPPKYLSEQEIIQILQYEAEELGVSFDSKQDTIIKLFNSDIEIALDLYNEEKQIGVAIVDRSQANDLITTGAQVDTSDMRTSGTIAEGILEDEQPVNFFLASDIAEYREDDLRQAFREFIEWLQSEGII